MHYIKTGYTVEVGTHANHFTPQNKKCTPYHLNNVEHTAMENNP